MNSPPFLSTSILSYLSNKWGLFIKGVPHPVDQRRASRLSGCHGGSDHRKRMEAAHHAESANSSLAVQRAETGLGEDQPKVLADSLCSMEVNGIITRTACPEVPPRVEYALSDLGESMRPIMKSMGNRSTEYKKASFSSNPFPCPKAKKSSTPTAHCSFLCCKSYFTVTEVMWGLTPSYQ